MYHAGRQTEKAAPTTRGLRDKMSPMQRGSRELDRTAGLPVVFVIALLPGCYLSFGLGHAPDASVLDASLARDASRPSIDATIDAPIDASIDAPTDTLLDATMDARRERPDAGPALPIEPEPDAGPDERPTGPWVDVPPPPAGEPALVPVGEVVQLDDEVDLGSPPALVWNGDGWGVAWSNQFRVLDADGRPVGDAVTTPGGWAVGIGLDFAIGRYAVAIGTPSWGSAPLQLGAFDRRATLAAGWEPGARADEVDIGRLASAHEWVVGMMGSWGGPSAVRAYAADDEMRRLGEPLELSVNARGDVRVAGAKSRAVVVWTIPDGVMAQVLRGPPLVRDGTPFRVMSMPQESDSAVEVESYRDLVAVAAMDGAHLQVSLIDAWTRTTTGTPIIVGESGVMDRRPGLAVASERGFFVACWATGAGPAGGSEEDGIALRVIGADGALWGERLDLVVHERNVGGVDCGWNGREIVVVWWRAAGDGAYNSIFSQRVRPTFL